MQRSPLPSILALVVLAAASSRIAEACPIPVTPIWTAIDEAGWFGLLERRCESVPLTDEQRARWFRDVFDLELEIDVKLDPGPDAEDEGDPLSPPHSVVRLVEWQALRTISGNVASIPDAARVPWSCAAAGRQPPAIVAFSPTGWSFPTPLSTELPSEAELDAALAWVQRAVRLRSRHGDRLNDGHRVGWIVEGIVDPATRRIALEELAATIDVRPTGPDGAPSPFGSGERDRILRAFVERPDVPGTLPGMLLVLRSEPSLAVDLAAVDAMNAEFARLDSREDAVQPWLLRWTLVAVLERIGIEDATARVDLALDSLDDPGVAPLREVWRKARCESGYAARVECEPEAVSAQPDPTQP